MKITKSTLKEHASLIIGLGLPILMVIVIAVAIYVPTLTSHPKYNFVYLSGGGYPIFYSVENGKLSKKDQAPPAVDKLSAPAIAPYSNSEKLYLYNISTDKATEISYDAAAGLHLSGDQESPDAYMVTNSTYSGGVFPMMLSGSDYNAHYMQGHHVSKKLHISAGDSPYGGYGFQFLGWVLE